MRCFAWLASAALILGTISAAGVPAGNLKIRRVTFDDAPPNVEAGVPAALPAEDGEKLGWIVWTWDEESRRDPGQTFRVEKDIRVGAVSILIASAENMGGQSMVIEFEEYGDVEGDVPPTKEKLAVYRGILPDDFDRQSPGRWVTFHLSRPMSLRRDRGYAFRFAFEQAKDYELRRCFIRATNVDADGKPRSAAPGRMIHQTGDENYAEWGTVEDMIFVLRTGVSN